MTDKIAVNRHETGAEPEIPDQEIPLNIKIQQKVGVFLQRFPMPIRVPLAIGIFVLWLVLFLIALPFLVCWGVFTWCKGAIIVHLPIKYQRKYYERYKKHLTTVVASKLSPLMAYPFCMFVELELDKHFEEGGMKAVLKEVAGFGDRFQERFERNVKPTLDKIGGEGVSPEQVSMAAGMGLLFDPADPNAPYEPGHEESHGWSRSRPVETDVSMADKKQDLAAAVTALNSGQAAPPDKEDENVSDEEVS